MGACVNNIDRSIVTDTSRLPNISGVTVLRVRRGAPAEQAGIQVGDIILEINDIPINYTTQFLEVLYRYAPGDGIKVAYIHNVSETAQETTVTLQEENWDR